MLLSNDTGRCINLCESARGFTLELSYYKHSLANSLFSFSCISTDSYYGSSWGTYHLDLLLERTMIVGPLRFDESITGMLLRGFYGFVGIIRADSPENIDDSDVSLLWKQSRLIMEESIPINL